MLRRVLIRSIFHQRCLQSPGFFCSALHLKLSCVKTDVVAPFFRSALTLVQELLETINDGVSFKKIEALRFFFD